jgi:hypothetical protein
VLDGKAMTLVPQKDRETMMLKDETTVTLPYRCGNPHAYGFASERLGEVGAGGAVMPRCFARRTDHLGEVCCGGVKESVFQVDCIPDRIRVLRSRR